jgi:hypothetical protein
LVAGSACSRSSCCANRNSRVDDDYLDISLKQVDAVGAA